MKNGTSTQRRKGAELATLLQPVKGKFSSWKQGEVVKARFTGSGYLIEKLHWKRPQLPLVNQCAGIPKSILEFHSPR